MRSIFTLAWVLTFSYIYFLSANLFNATAASVKQPTGSVTVTHDTAPRGPVSFYRPAMKNHVTPRDGEDAL